MELLDVLGMAMLKNYVNSRKMLKIMSRHGLPTSGAFMILM